jgi:hypothetical protein
MRFGIYGYMSNGEGLCDFYTYDINKLKKLKEIPFSVMNFFIMKYIESCCLSNSCGRFMNVSLSEINLFYPYLSLTRFTSILKKLEAEELIKFEKYRGLKIWKIYMDFKHIYH